MSADHVSGDRIFPRIRAGPDRFPAHAPWEPTI